MHGDGISCWQLPNGKWTGQLTIRLEDGSRKKHQRRRSTRKEAYSAIKELQERLSRQSVEDPKTLRELLPGYIEYKRARVRPNTAADYKHQLELWVLPTLGDKLASSISARDVIVLLQGLNEQGLSSSTINTVRARLSTFFEYAVLIEQAEANPCRKVESMRPNGKSLVKQPWSLEETRDALAKAAGTELEVFLYFAVFLGMRKGEILALRWGDVNFQEGWVQIDKTRSNRRVIGDTGEIEIRDITNDPKTFSGFRRLPLPPPLLVALMSERERRQRAEQTTTDGDFLVRGVGGGKLSVSVLTRYWRRFCDESGVRRIRIHDIRHTSIVQALEAGARLEDASQGAGHSSVEVTKRIYARYVPASANRFALALSERLSGDEAETQGAFLRGGVNVDN
jgi:integrase